ncbi:MAG: beta-lactamase family protein, partial [Bacteroidales bacterium]|nr:beta-lactamase family protein [Bacteroidales bacterium]
MKPILKISAAILLFSQLIGCIDTNQSGDYQAILNDDRVVQPYINQRYKSQIEKQQKKLARYIKKNDIPSVAIAIAKNGEIVWEQGFGLSNIEKNTRSSQHTSYPLASVSKNLTATGMMMLVDRGMVDLEKPVNNYLETKINVYQGHEIDATVKRVLLHTSGLPLFYWGFQMDEIKPSFDEVIEKHGIIVFPPGERSLYSNLGYGIIQKIIENVSGESLSVYIKESVIDPLHLSNTFLFTFDSIHSENIAIEYLNDGSPAVFVESVECGAGGFYSSAHDLLIYGMHHLNKDFPNISSRHIDYMQSAFDPDIGTDGYGLGWEIYEAGTTRIIKHNGGGLGCDTRLTLIPSENMVVVVLKNSRRGSSTYIASNIAEAFGEQYNRKNDNYGINNRSTLVAHGRWNGNIITFSDTIPVSILINQDRSVECKLRGAVYQSNVKNINGMAEIRINEEVLQLGPPEEYILFQLSFSNDKAY